MRTLYTNEGSFFGYLKSEYLYTYKGLCVGKMVEDIFMARMGSI